MIQTMTTKKRSPGSIRTNVLSLRLTPEAVKHNMHVVESAMVPTGNSGAHNFGMLAPPPE